MENHLKDDFTLTAMKRFFHTNALKNSKNQMFVSRRNSALTYEKFFVHSDRFDDIDEIRSGFQSAVFQRLVSNRKLRTTDVSVNFIFNMSHQLRTKSRKNFSNDRQKIYLITNISISANEIYDKITNFSGKSSIFYLL